MNYEQCKALKEAGFSQEGNGTSFVTIASLGGKEIDPNTGRANYVYAPTLSELIEACITSGGYSGFALLWSLKHGWTANLESLADNPFALGETPEEAVANLYLALKGT